MRFLRAAALFLFLRFQNLVDEKFRSILMLCYENSRRHSYYSTFILREITHRERQFGLSLYYEFEWITTNWPGFGRRPRFASNTCSSLHSSTPL